MVNLVFLQLLWSNVSSGVFLPVGAARLMQDILGGGETTQYGEGTESIDRLENLLILENISVAVVPPAVYK